MSGLVDVDSDATADVDTDTGTGTDIDVGVSTPAAVGLYLAVVAIGVVSLVSAAVSASGEVFLTSVPTALVAGLLGGIVLTRVRPELVRRLGAWRWRTVALCLPALLLSGGAIVLDAAAFMPEAGITLLFAVPAAGVALMGRVVALAAHDTYVGATTDDTPAVGWTWNQSGYNPPMITAGSIAIVLAGILYVFTGFSGNTLRLGFVSLVCLATGWAPTLRIPKPDGSTITLLSIPDFDYVRGEIRACENGLVIEPRFKPSYRRVVPWGRITDVRLTERELVLERRWWPDVRCDRSAIDDVDAVTDAIRAKQRSARPAGAVSVDEPQF